MLISEPQDCVCIKTTLSNRVEESELSALLLCITCKENMENLSNSALHVLLEVTLSLSLSRSLTFVNSHTKDTHTHIVEEEKTNNGGQTL